jgi:hypothetical protein
MSTKFEVDVRIPGQKRTGDPIPFLQLLNWADSRNHFPVLGARFRWISQCLRQLISSPLESQLSIFSRSSFLSCNSNCAVIFAVKKPIDFTYASAAILIRSFAEVKAGLEKRFFKVPEYYQHPSSNGNNTKLIALQIYNDFGEILCDSSREPQRSTVYFVKLFVVQYFFEPFSYFGVPNRVRERFDRIFNLCSQISGIVQGLG